MKQRLKNTQHEVYDVVPVLAGPHAWIINEYLFSTVVVRCEDDPKGKLSMIDVRSGARLGRIECKAPRTRPHEAMQACSRLLTYLQDKHAPARIAAIIRSSEDLPADDV